MNTGAKPLRPPTISLCKLMQTSEPQFSIGKMGRLTLCFQAQNFKFLQFFKTRADLADRGHKMRSWAKLLRSKEKRTHLELEFC